MSGGIEVGIVITGGAQDIAENGQVPLVFLDVDAAGAIGLAGFPSDDPVADVGIEGGVSMDPVHPEGRNKIAFEQVMVAMTTMAHHALWEPIGLRVGEQSSIIIVHSGAGDGLKSQGARTVVHDVVFDFVGGGIDNPDAIGGRTDAIHQLEVRISDLAVHGEAKFGVSCHTLGGVNVLDPAGIGGPHGEVIGAPAADGAVDL